VAPKVTLAVQTSLGAAAAGPMAVVANISQDVVNCNRRVQEMEGEMQCLKGEVEHLQSQVQFLLEHMPGAGQLPPPCGSSSYAQELVIRELPAIAMETTRFSTLATDLFKRLGDLRITKRGDTTPDFHFLLRLYGCTASNRQVVEGYLVYAKLVSFAEINSGTYTEEITQQIEKLAQLHKGQGAHTSPTVVWRGRVSSELRQVRKVILAARKTHVELPANIKPVVVPYPVIRPFSQFTAEYLRNEPSLRAMMNYLRGYGALSIHNMAWGLMGVYKEVLYVVSIVRPWG